MVAIGIEVESSERALGLARRYEGVHASAGVHPNAAKAWDDAAHARIDELLQADEVVAVGESGLDFYREHTPHDIQRAAFRDHIALSKSHDKALVIHTRNSTTAAIEELENAGVPSSVIFHCWSGDKEELARALELGACISFAGNLSFKSAEDVRAAARLVPSDRLLVETDSPYLAPVPHRGRPNEPGFVALVGAAVAAARAEEETVVAGTTTSNARRLFGLER